MEALAADHTPPPSDEEQEMAWAGRGVGDHRTRDETEGADPYQVAREATFAEEV